MDVSVVLEEFVALERLWGSHNLIGGACLLKGLRISELAECLHRWLVDLVDNSLSLLKLDKLSEVPGELLGKVEVVLDVLRVDVPVVQHIFQHENVKYTRITPDLLVLIGAVLEFDLSFYFFCSTGGDE